MPLDSIIQLPNLYINGLDVSNDATTPNTKINISAGSCRDSTNSMDMLVGEADAEGKTVSAPLVVNSAIVGANGLDAGSLQENKMYAVYLIGDSRGYKETAGLLSLASNASPTMPFEYDSFRKIGFIRSGAGPAFLAGYASGAGNYRSWTYDSILQVLGSGTATSLTNVDLTDAVPPQQDMMINLRSNFNANAANDLLSLKTFSSSLDIQVLHAASAAGTAHLTYHNDLLVARLNSGAPTIKYAVSAGSVALFVVSFWFAV